MSKQISHVSIGAKSIGIHSFQYTEDCEKYIRLRGNTTITTEGYEDIKEPEGGAINVTKYTDMVILLPTDDEQRKLKIVEVLDKMVSDEMTSSIFIDNPPTGSHKFKKIGERLLGLEVAGMLSRIVLDENKEKHLYYEFNANDYWIKKPVVHGLLAHPFMFVFPFEGYICTVSKESIGTRTNDICYGLVSNTVCPEYSNVLSILKDYDTSHTKDISKRPLCIKTSYLLTQDINAALIKYRDRLINIKSNILYIDKIPTPFGFIVDPPLLMNTAVDIYKVMERYVNDTPEDVWDITEYIYDKNPKGVYSLKPEFKVGTKVIKVKVNNYIVRLYLNIQLPDRNSLNRIKSPDVKVELIIVDKRLKQFMIRISTPEGNGVYYNPFSSVLSIKL